MTTYQIPIYSTSQNNAVLIIVLWSNQVNSAHFLQLLALKLTVTAKFLKLTIYLSILHVNGLTKPAK